MRLLIRDFGRALVVLAGIALALGCDTPTDAGESRPALMGDQISGSGVVRGTVRVVGAPPAMSERTVPCHEGSVTVADESVVVNENGSLRNVFVYLEGVPATDGRDVEPVLLDQVDCRYVPHVIGVQVGQVLRVRSSDATLHNVHCLATKNRAVNLSMTGAGQERSITFTRPEFIPVKCDVHPWMLAYVGVFDHPWFVATGADGAFRIEGIPAGSYKLVTWHEQYGRLEQDVTINDDQTIEASFEYRQQSAGEK